MFCRSKGQVSLSCSGSIKGTLPDFWTRLIQTNSRHQHSVKWLFLRGGIQGGERCKVTGQVEGSI